MTKTDTCGRGTGTLVPRYVERRPTPNDDRIGVEAVIITRGYPILRGNSKFINCSSPLFVQSEPDFGSSRSKPLKRISLLQTRSLLQTGA